MAAALDPKPDREHDEDPDALLASLEEEDDSTYRAQRLQELKAQASTSGSGTTAKQANSFVTLKDDDETLRFTTEYERAMVHFFHPDFARCLTMDEHCQQVASKHAEMGDADAAFGRVDVKNAPFVVEKLSIRILPCVLGFVKGVVKGRVTGFEGIASGREDTASVTRALEGKLVDWTILSKKLIEEGDDSDTDQDEEGPPQNGRRGITGGRQQVDDEDDDWD